MSMYFDFSGDQQALRETVQRFLADRAPVRYVREMYDDPAGTTVAVWAGLAEMGLMGILIPEEFGGLGQGLVDMGVVLEEMGRAVHPGPFFSSAVVAPSVVLAVGDEADHAELLPAIASGATVATVGLLEPGQRYRWQEPVTRATPVADGWQLSGTKAHVPDAARADLLFLTAATDEGVGLFALDATNVEVAPEDVLDGTRKQATVMVREAPARRVGSGDATDAIGRALDQVLVGSVVDAVGAGQAALDLAIGYAKVRTQFDRPIGAFQHVQRLCVDAFEMVEASRTVGYYGLWACEGTDAVEAHRAAAMAKAFASDALPAACAWAVQAHGGIGVTWEHDLHLFYKRCLSMQLAHGAAAEYYEELASILMDA
jgi:alkylation response protein AidB-like acyl-CoA dehydrogenase